MDWTQETILSEYSNREGQAVHKFVSWRVMALSYWLFDVIPTDRNIQVRLYLAGKNYWEGMGYVESATKRIYDTLLHEQIEIVGQGVLEGKM